MRAVSVWGAMFLAGVLGCFCSASTGDDDGTLGDAGVSDGAFVDGVLVDGLLSDAAPGDAAPTEDAGMRDGASGDAAAGDTGVGPEPGIIDRTGIFEPAGPLPPSRCGLSAPLDLDGDGVPFMAEPIVEVPLREPAFSIFSGRGMVYVLSLDCEGCAVTVDETGVHRFEGVRRSRETPLNLAISDRGTVWEVEHEGRGRRIWWFRCGASGHHPVADALNTRRDLRRVAGTDAVILGGSGPLAIVDPDAVLLEVDGADTVFPLCGDGVCAETLAPAYAFVAAEEDGRVLHAHGAFGTRRIREQQAQLTGLRSGTVAAEGEDPWFCAQSRAGDPLELVRVSPDGTVESRRLDAGEGARCDRLVRAGFAEASGPTWLLYREDGLTLVHVLGDDVRRWRIPDGSSFELIALPDGVGVLTRHGGNGLLRLYDPDEASLIELLEDVRRVVTVSGTTFVEQTTGPDTTEIRWSRLASVAETGRSTITWGAPVAWVEWGERQALVLEGFASRPRAAWLVRDGVRVREVEELGELDTLTRIDMETDRPRLASCRDEACTLWEESESGAFRALAEGLAPPLEMFASVPSPWISAGPADERALYQVDVAEVRRVEVPGRFGTPTTFPAHRDGARNLAFVAFEDWERLAVYRTEGPSLLRVARGARDATWIASAGTQPLIADEPVLCILGPGAARCEPVPDGFSSFARYPLALSPDGRLVAATGPTRPGMSDIEVWRGRLPPAP